MSTERDDRLRRRQLMIAGGVNPYPSVLQRTHTVREILDGFGTWQDQSLTVAGRVRSVRAHGGSSFIDLEDASARIQCYLKADVVGEQLYASLMGSLDDADFLEVTGQATTTKRGEKTILASRARIIAKAILPLPSQWYGLEDIEERYRKRYLDLLLHPEVRDRLKRRAAMLRLMRSFFEQRDFIEVATPTLQPLYGGGLARPFVTHHNALESDLYLCISDELYLKRLIVGGFERVFEIYKVFRNEGIDRNHNPEFTMLEAQIAYQEYRYGMDFIEELFENVAIGLHQTTAIEYQSKPLQFQRPWKRWTMCEAIRETIGIDPLRWKSLKDARETIADCSLTEHAQKKAREMSSIGELTNLVFEELVTPTLWQPTIIYNYPVEISPLAKKCEDDPRFTQQFEYFAAGMELGNNYTELNDPVELSERFVSEKNRERLGFDEAHQTDNDYITAIEHGFPPTCGLSVGIDRAAMVFTNASTIKEVIPFPTLKYVPGI